MHDISISIRKGLQDKVWQGMCFIVGSLSGILSFWNFLLNENGRILAFVEMLLAAYSVYVYLHVKQWSRISWPQYGYVLFLSFIVLYAVWVRPLTNGLIVWPMLLPILSYLALGLRKGSIVSIGVMLTMLLMLSIKGQQETHIGLLSVLINFFFCYLCVMGVSHVYERNRLRVEEDLVDLARTDALTGIKNRLAFKQDFEQYIQTRSGLGLMMMDLDYFKSVNDTYGHEAGDELLSLLTQRIQNSFSNIRLYRQGGEEFCLLAESDKAELIVQAEGIRIVVSNTPFVVGGEEINVTVSLGVACIDEVNKATDLIVLADQRMYSAKRQGRNCVVSD